MNSTNNCRIFVSESKFSIPFEKIIGIFESLCIDFIKQTFIRVFFFFCVREPFVMRCIKMQIFKIFLVWGDCETLLKRKIEGKY